MDAMDIATPFLSAVAAGGACWKAGLVETTSWTNPCRSMPPSFRLTPPSLSTAQQDTTMNIFKRSKAVTPDPAKRTTIQADPPPTFKSMGIDYSSLGPRPDTAPTKASPTPAATDPAPKQPDPPPAKESVQSPQASAFRRQGEDDPETVAGKQKPLHVEALKLLTDRVSRVDGSVAELIGALESAQHHIKYLAGENSKLNNEVVQTRSVLEAERGENEKYRQTVEAQIEGLAEMIAALERRATPPVRA